MFRTGLCCGSQNEAGKWVFGCRVAQILTHLCFPEEPFRGRGRFTQGHTEGRLISVFLQPREQAILSHRRLHVGLPGWRLAKPLASTLLLAVPKAAAQFPRLVLVTLWDLRPIGKQLRVEHRLSRPPRPLRLGDRR